MINPWQKHAVLINQFFLWSILAEFQFGMIRIPATSVTDEARAPMLPLSRPRSCYGSVARRSPIVLQELVLYSCIYRGGTRLMLMSFQEGLYVIKVFGYISANR